MGDKKIIHKLEFIFLCLMLVLCISCPGNNTHANAAAKKTTLKTKKTTIFINGKYTIPMKNKFKKATYFYTSNKTEIARVNSKGIITGIGKGTASIRVRYKHKGEFHSAGTFKITVKNSTLKKAYKTLDLTTGESRKPSEYLDGANPDASYIITSSSSVVATAENDGVITARKAGRTSLSIHEVFNKRSRTVGSIALTVTGASLKRDEIKIPYNTTKNKYDLLDDITASAKYTFTSSDSKLVSTTANSIRSLKSTGNKSCKVTVTEQFNKKPVRTIGTITVNLSDEPFIAIDDKNISIGIGEILSVGSNIKISNRNTKAKYEFEPKDPKIISADKYEAIAFGVTTVTIKQELNKVKTTLEDTVTVTVSPAFIKKEIATNGLSFTVNGDTYNQYPIDCRNQNATYDYESSDTSIISAGTKGMNKGEDILVVNAKKAGEAEITVYETIKTTGVRSKIGSFRVTVTGGTSDNNNNNNNNNNNGTNTLLNPVASNLITSITFKHKGKVYNGTVSTTSLECVFGDENGNYIDYGTDFSSINPGEFDIKTVNGYSFTSITTTDNYEWIASIKLNDDEDTVVEVPVSLIPGELNVSSILNSITVNLGDNAKQIKNDTKFPEDNSLNQFDNSNTNFFVNYTAQEYINAGIKETNITDNNSVNLSGLNNVKCSVEQNTFGPSNTTANSAVAGNLSIENHNNSYWSIKVLFEDGSTEYFNVTLGVDG